MVNMKNPGTICVTVIFLFQNATLIHVLFQNATLLHNMLQNIHT